MGSATANHRAQTDDAAVFARQGQAVSHQGDFEGTGGTDDVDITLAHAVALQKIQCALQKTLGDKGVKSRDNDGNRFMRSNQAPFKYVHGVTPGKLQVLI